MAVKGNGSEVLSQMQVSFLCESDNQGVCQLSWQLSCLQDCVANLDLSPLLVGWEEAHYLVSMDSQAPLNPHQSHRCIGLSSTLSINV